MAQLILGVAVLLAVAYLAAVVYLYRRLFVPGPARRDEELELTPWEFHADYEDFDLVTADGIGFGGWFLRQPGSPQTVVVSGGHKALRDDCLGVAVALWRKGFNVLLYSYRGTPGGDPATVTMGLKEVNELQATIAFARQHIPGARIGLLGFSMGGAVSMLAAAGEPSVEALVLDSPFADLNQLVSENVRRAILLPGAPFRFAADLALQVRAGCRMSDCSPIAVLGALELRPIFLIHGGADRRTSVAHSRKLYDAYRGPREIWIVQGAPHVGAYYADRELYVERVGGFFTRTLGLSRSSQLRLVDEEVG